MRGNDLKEAADILQNSVKDEIYHQHDLEASSADEVVHFKHYWKEKSLENHSLAKLLRHIRENELQLIFPSVNIVYILLNCISVYDCTSRGTLLFVSQTY